MLFAEDANRALRDGSRGCLFGTRTEITDAGRDWATGVPPQGERPPYLDAFDTESSVLWLCGVAGAGKSSIAITLAKVLEEMGLLGSLYSFQAAKQETLNPTNLFSTITRHLAQHNPRREQRLIKIIHESKPNSRATSSPGDQFEKFLLALLADDINRVAVQPTVIIIDAFDECGNTGSRREILNILTHRAHELPPGIRILVTSRYEADIQHALESQPKNMRLLQMEHIPKESTERDIKAYIDDALRPVPSLRSEEYIPKLAQLALASQQSFQWASVACSFIKDDDDGDAALTPRLRLKQVLQSNEGLDPLYRMILDRYFGFSNTNILEPVRTILGCIVCAKEPLSLRSIIDLGTDSPALSKFDSDDYHHLARKLSSLVTGTQNLDAPLIPLHTSFTDFLGNNVRSHQKYFIDRALFNKRLASGCLRIMLATLQFNICRIPTSSKSNAEIENIEELIKAHIPNSLSYACRFWAHHVSKVKGWTELNLLRESVTALLGDRILEWLEVMSLTESVPLNSLRLIDSVHQVMPLFYHCFRVVLIAEARFHHVIPTFPTSSAKHPGLQHTLQRRL